MKRTRTLMLALALSMLTPAYADIKYDALRPQEIITVAEGQTIRNSDTGFTVDLTQANVGQSNTNRTAIAKDGQGTLVIDRAVDMYCPIVVREGTLLIKDTDVTDHPYLESPVLTVGGINAQMVLDNATFTQTTEYGRGYVAAVSVGGRDGDGTLTLQNGAVLTHAQSFFLGGVSYVAPLDGNDTGAHICGSYLSTEGDTLFRDKAGENGGFINPHVGTRGRLSTGTLNVLSGSTYNTGIGFYGGNGTINIDGEGSVINSGVRAADADNTMLGWTSSTYAKCVLNITNGGVYNAGVNAAQDFYTSQYSDTTAEINISGQGSALNISGNAAISNGRSYTNCHTAIRVDDHGSIHVAKHLQMSYGGQYSTMQLTNGGDVTVDGQFIIGANGWVETDAASTIHANVLFVMSGGTFLNRGTIARNEGVDEVPEAGYIGLYRGSRFQTGIALLSGRQDPNIATGDPVGVIYTTGLDSVGVYFCDAGSGAVTIGALLEGDTVMQYLKRADMQTINAEVQARLSLMDAEGYEVKFQHEIGRNVTVEYTTDELNHKTGQESLVVAGGSVVVAEGVQEDPETKVGTIGSYRETVAETHARLAVSETEAGSRIWWQGTGLQTVAEETAVFNKDFALDINGGEGRLTVVSDSELQNEAEIKACITVEKGAVLTNRGVLRSETTVDGTLKGAGTIAATTVQEGGNLIVGNSPGLVTATGDLTLASGSTTTFSVAGLEFPATAELDGWDSGTYSRISLQEGAALVMKEAGIKFIIELGGEDLYAMCGVPGADSPLALNLLLGKGAITLPESYTGMRGQVDVTDLINTVFTVTMDEEAGVGNADHMYVGFREGDYHYYVTGTQEGFRDLMLVGSGVIGSIPEPATGTLGLLALASLCMRRRRI